MCSRQILTNQKPPIYYLSSKASSSWGQSICNLNLMPHPIILASCSMYTALVSLALSPLLLLYFFVMRCAMSFGIAWKSNQNEDVEFSRNTSLYFRVFEVCLIKFPVFSLFMKCGLCTLNWTLLFTHHQPRFFLSSFLLFPEHQSDPETRIAKEA